MKFVMRFVMKFVMLETILKNCHGLLEFVLGSPLGGGLTKIQGDHETLSIVRHVGLHVDFSSIKFFWGL